VHVSLIEIINHRLNNDQLQRMSRWLGCTKAAQIFKPSTFVDSTFFADFFGTFISLGGSLNRECAIRLLLYQKGSIQVFKISFSFIYSDLSNHRFKPRCLHF
jgi:hypothetical protein